jgi:hypothetical protein
VRFIMPVSDSRSPRSFDNKTMIRNTRNLIFGLVICLVVAGCGDTIKGKSIAEPQVAAFHEKLNAGQFDVIYSTSDEAFRKAAPKEKVLELFSAVQRKLGKAMSSSTKTWNVKTFNFETKVVLVVQTEFERGKGTESFTFRVSDGKASLVGYNINSLDMMTK